MIKTQNFRTKTNYIERQNPCVPGTWEIAIDIGYSAVKLFSPNIVASFPSYARRVNEEPQFVSTIPEESIFYKNLDTDETWIVGEIAQNTLETGDTSDSESSLYGRERYSSSMFKVITEVGLGIGMLKNKYGEPGKSKIIVQTGLPERYMNDTEDIKDSMEGKHNFALRLGSKDWVFFNFELSTDNIYVMSQPKGTLFSVCVDKNGRPVKGAPKLSSSIMVFDSGFGTLDLFPIREGIVKSGETYSDLGMKRILQETSKLIKDNYDVDIPVPFMQKYLETGNIRYKNKKERIVKEYSIDSLLNTACFKILNEAITRMESSFNMMDYDYLILTGGTCAPWLNKLENMFSGYSTLKIIKGNQNDDLPFIFSNVRGYFLYRYNELNKNNIKKSKG